MTESAERVPENALPAEPVEADDSAELLEQANDVDPRDKMSDIISRAGERFKLQDGMKAGDLMIENERLKTSIMVLTKKLKAQNHTADMVEKLTLRERDAIHENDDLKQKVSELETEIQMKVSECEGLVSKFTAQIEANQSETEVRVSKLRIHPH